MNQIILKDLEKTRPLLKDKKILIVRGASYENLEIKDFFDEFTHVEFKEFTPNPMYEQMCKGIELFNRENCELIVAVGGGSAIDVAKCIKLYCKMNSATNYLQQEMFDSEITLIAIPTTAGTGSESTCHAVIYYGGEKQSISHPSIIPNYAVLISTVLMTLPIYQKKCTLLDALSQAIESWWSVNSVDESKEYSKKAISLIKENWREYIFEYSDKSAQKIMEASNYAGRAINITATTAAHAMSYKITTMYKLPHGHAVAICLPEVWGYMIKNIDKCIDRRGQEYLKDIFSEIDKVMDLKYFISMLIDMDMKYPVAVDKDVEINILSKSVNLVRLKNTPVQFSENVLKLMYENIIL